jgi:hypothetical protein
MSWRYLTCQACQTVVFPDKAGAKSTGPRGPSNINPDNLILLFHAPFRSTYIGRSPNSFTYHVFVPSSRIRPIQQSTTIAHDVMFDQTSGQVFKEWTVPRRSFTTNAGLDWSRRRPYPLFTARGAKGPRSLIDMTINVIANNIGDVTYEMLEVMPLRLVWRIWRFLEARGVCLHAWKLFSRLLLREDDDKTLGLYRFRQHICRPDVGLKHYVQPMSSPSVEFITHLVISGGCAFSTHEMLCLAEMKNLGVLEIIQPADQLRAVFPDVTDGLIKGWTEIDDPFPLLRVLRIWGDQSTTQQSLQWLSRFPTLAVYDVMGSREDWPSPHEQGLDVGWELAQPISGVEDSLLSYLMLFAPAEDIRNNRIRDLSRSIDADLVSLCGDSRCALKFVGEQDAPLLLDYLTDNAKVSLSTWDTDAVSREARACHGVPFEAWAFWLYSFIGQLSNNRDLEKRQVKSEAQAVVGPFVLPSKPIACLFMGHSGRGGISFKPSYVSRGLFSTRRYTFIRPSVVREASEPPVKPIPPTRANTVVSERTESSMNIRKQKRKRLDDVLQAFSS